MNAPSKKRLMNNLGLTSEQADIIRALIRKERKTYDSAAFPQANAWFAECYNKPFWIERVMACINEVMQGHGVEAIADEKNWSTTPLAVYVNLGETYTPTILYSSKSGTFSISSWGDYVESQGVR